MTYTRKFYSPKSLNSFKRKLPPNRIKSEYEYTEQKTGKKVFAIKYYRDTKALRKEHKF